VRGKGRKKVVEGEGWGGLEEQMRKRGRGREEGGRGIRSSFFFSCRPGREFPYIEIIF